VILMPIVHVTDMQRSLDFYESLGFEPQVRGAHWSELRAGDGAILALHVGDRSNLELALTARDRLEDVVERHGNALARPITDEAFGRSLVLRDPDGLELQVNEHDS
jgi:catechol 2,3-dioxygenase-like lactoylglutathione lyase family enzyme